MRAIASVIATAMMIGVPWAQPAQANVIFRFLETSETVTYASGGRLAAYGQLVVTDEAAAAGIDLAFRKVGGDTQVARVNGLLDLRFEFRGFQRFGIPEFFADHSFGALGYLAEFYFRALPGETPIGSVRFNNTETDFAFALDGVMGSGDYNSDRAGGLCGSTRCTFQAATVATVPEPAALSLLGVGIAGLAMTRRRRATS